MPLIVTTPFVGLTSDAYVQEVLGDSPFAYWRLNETSLGSPPTVVEEVGGSPTLDGAYNGGPSVGQLNIVNRTDVDLAPLFDGVNDDVGSIGEPEDFDFIHQTGVFSLECWFKLRDSTQLERGTFIGSNSNLSQYGFTWEYDLRASGGSPDQRDRIRFYILNGSGSGFAVDTRIDDVGIKNENIHYGVVTGDGVNIRIYIDGVQQGSPDPIGSLSAVGNAENRTKIGVRDITVPLNFDGYIAHCAIYKNTLTPTQITAHYDLGKF